jgi:uncharacterized Ntn-hydrolase superfamily protein
MTFSIVARSVDTNLFGVAIASSSPAVAARCAHGRAGTGAAATQNITDPRLGPRILDAMGRGADALAAISEALSDTPFGSYRQLLAIGRHGPPAIHSGARSLGLVNSALSRDAAAAGNLLADRAVPHSMIAAFESATGHLGERLLQALRAGLDAGGEAGPVHSAGLLIVREVSWPIVDLRVDWTDDDPVAALGAIWRRYQPQIDDYVLRAIDPGRAPGFAVPGDGPT